MHPYFVQKGWSAVSLWKSSIALGVSVASACSVPSKEPHPENVEREDIATTASGACGTATPIDPATFFSGPYRASKTRPAEGTELAFEGVPRGLGLCTQKGCSFECCDNSCGFDRACAYALPIDRYNHVCLAHADFRCGGTDCSFYCAPFSDEPTRRYRFVGAIRYDEGLRPILDVARFCRVE
jgi:hypothetical protein